MRSTKNYSTALLVSGIVGLSLAEGLTHFAQAYVDSRDYIEDALFFLGKYPNLTGVPRLRLLLRPLVPFLASLLSLAVKPRIAFGLVNLVFWCASAVLMFYFTRLLTKSVSAAVASSVFLTSSIPLLILGAAIYTDMAGYFFILLGAFLIVKWDLPRAKLKRVVVAGFIVQLGMLARESVASVLLFAIAWCILSRGSFRRILLFVGIVVGLSVLWSTLVGVSYVQWYNIVGVNGGSPYPKLGFLLGADVLLRSIVYAFGEIPIVLLLSLLGLLRIRDFRELKIYLSFLVPVTLLIVTWPVPGTRYSFILFPAILPLAGLGVEEAYSVILQSPLISTNWPSFKTSSKALVIFELLIMAAYVVSMNLLTIRYVSFPWNPLIDPALPPGYVQFLRNY